jgi:hypothetical protein
MRHHSARTALICIAAFACIAGGTAIGVGLQRGSAGAPPVAVGGPAAASNGAVDPGTVPGGGADGVPADSDEEGGDNAPDPAADQARADEAGDDDRAENQNPPRGNQPEIPDLELNPGGVPRPGFVPPAGNGNDDPPPPADPPPPSPPAPTPLSIFQTGRIGPGPLWERGGPRACPGSQINESSWITVAVHQIPRSTPYRVTATARVGNVVVPATVQQEQGQPARFTVYFSFPRGSVRAPANIAVNATVTDAQGRRATMPEFGGRNGIGHRLFPADYCP